MEILNLTLKGDDKKVFMNEKRKTSCLDNIVTIFKDKIINGKYRVEIISLTIGAILVLTGILACMWEPYNQEQIIKSISLAFF